MQEFPDRPPTNVCRRDLLQFNIILLENEVDDRFRDIQCNYGCRLFAVMFFVVQTKSFGVRKILASVSAENAERV